MNHPLTPLPPFLRKILKQPSFEGSAIRIELVHRSKHIQEYLPDRLFCFAIIVQGCAGDSEDQSIVPFKQHRQGIVAAHAQGRHEIFVTEHLKAIGGEEQGCQFVVR
jgi:hypothetical protein